MNPRAEIRPQARDDLYEQFLYMSNRGNDLAWRFLDALESTVDRLVELPDLGIKYRAGQSGTEEVRVWKVKGFPNHLIFYSPAGDAIHVLRILHGARDHNSILGLDSTEQ